MPEKQKSAMDQFLGDIPVSGDKQEGDIFESDLEGKDKETVVAPEKEEEVIVETPKDNREARRAKRALALEKQSNIELNARIVALTEAQRFSRDVNETNVDDSLLRLYGDNENGRAAAKITQDLLNKTKADARAEALDIFRQEQEKEREQYTLKQRELDTMLDEIEDEFDVDLTSNTPAAKKAQQEFFTLLEKVSPKTKDGVVTDYADAIATWELYQASNKKDNSRAKDLGSRTMVKSGASQERKLEDTVQERFLKDAGII